MGNLTRTINNDLVSFKTPGRAKITSLICYFDPYQAGSDDPSPSNVRSISKYKSAKINHTGKNIADFTPYYSLNVGGNSGLGGGLLYTPSLQAQKITYSCLVKSKSGSGRIRAMVYNSSWKQLGTISGNKVTNKNGISSFLSGPSDERYLHSAYIAVTGDGVCTDFMCEFGETPTKYEPYRGKVYDVAIPDDVSMAGGYIDLVSGTLTITHWFDTLSAVNNEKLSDAYNTDQTVFFRCSCSYPFETLNGSPYVKDLKCDILKPYGFNWGSGDAQDAHVNTITQRYNNNQAVCMRMYNNVFGITSKDTVAQRKDKVNAWLAENPIHISYKLATPIVISLEPMQLETLVGQNHIWSSFDLSVTYEYLENAKITDIKRKIIRNEPHIATASGSIASFNTNMKAPLKSAKIYFNPIQEGSGDPSPENVREITPITTFDIYQTKKNFLDYSQTTVITQNVDITPKVTLPPGTYIFSMDIATNSDIKGIVAIRLNNELTNYITQRFDKKFNGRFSLQFTLTETSEVRANLGGEVAGYSFEISNRMFSNSIDTTYEIYNGSTKIINLSSLNSIYGGYIDLISGELIQNKVLCTINGSEQLWLYKYDNNDMLLIYFSTLFEGTCTDTHIIGNYIKDRISNNEVWAGNADLANKWLRVYFPKDEFIDKTALITYLSNHNLQVVFSIEPQIITTLTPTQLNSLRGTNNIWSNANGNIEVKYWTH